MLAIVDRVTSRRTGKTSTLDTQGKAAMVLQGDEQLWNCDNCRLLATPNVPS